MKPGKRHVPLAGKFAVAVCILMGAVGLLFSLMFYRYEKAIMLKGLAEHARFASDLVMRGIHYGMLTAQRDVIQQNVEKLGSSEGISGIVIYDRQGKVFAATDRRRIGSSIRIDPYVRDAFEGRSRRPELTTDSAEQKALRHLTPIFTEPSCSAAQCHFHPAEERVLGVLEMDLTATSVLESSRRILLGTFLFGALFAAIVSLALILILYKLVTKPLGIMEEGMRRLARGDFEHPIEIHTRDEMEFLASTFNSMTQDIKRYRVMLEDWAEKLQVEVEKKTREISEAQEHLIDAEKLASLGRLAAGVAHELNSPLTGILSFSHLMRQRMDPGRKEDIEDLDVIIQQTNRCSKIIKGLLGFARKGASEQLPVNINEVLESATSMVMNQSKFHDVELPLHLGEGLPQVIVDPNLMQQVFINMLTNAADAMDNKGKITITTRASGGDGKGDVEGEFVEVEFSDTGSGIMQEDMGKIFEPFFTTKPVGEGTGLGLPVSYGIIKRHGGDILVESTVGEGTSFRIRLPVPPGGSGTVGTV
jgi:two-component system NtrC family sensor kinase